MLGRALILAWRVFASLAGVCVIGAVLIALNLESILMIDRPLSKADHAVVLDGNNQRLLRAKELLDQGLVDDIYISNGEPARPDQIDQIVAELGYTPPDRTDIKVRILEKLGVPRDRLIVFGAGSLTTRDEAKALGQQIGLQSSRIILVTTNYHSRRALEIFKRAWPEAEFQVACPGNCVAPKKWWTDPAIAAQFILEFVKHIYFRLGASVA
mgnify:CR=1 FL=1